ncbi:hypothetical protein ACFYXM_33075 [Streptomyces sp. NPDC002476]|uniref:hypothetical protein n=1 Tax=Streptomyces sp. NPDC002476 TaxID=3364648 RepID=UPI0036978337
MLFGEVVEADLVKGGLVSRSVPSTSAVPVTSMPAYTNVAPMRSVRSFSRSVVSAPVVMRGLSR